MDKDLPTGTGNTLLFEFDTNGDVAHTNEISGSTMENGGGAAVAGNGSVYVVSVPEKTTLKVRII